MMDVINTLRAGEFNPQYGTICVDMFALAHFMYHSAMKQLKDDKGNKGKLEEVEIPNNHPKRDGVIFPRMALGMINYIEELQDTSKRVFLLFDNATSKTNARQYISEGYKSSRKAKPPAFYKTVDFVQFFATRTCRSNVRVIRVPSREADDLIKSLILFNETSQAGPDIQIEPKVLCIANDSDWYACLSKDVDMLWFGDTEPYTIETFKNEYGFEPTMKRVAVYKALMGDTADDIPKVLSKKHIDHDTLLYVINTYATGEHAESLPVTIAKDEKVGQKAKDELRENRDQYRLNLQLTDYMHTTLDRIDRYTHRGKCNLELRRTLLKALQGVIVDSTPVKKFSFGGVSANV